MFLFSNLCTPGQVSLFSSIEKQCFINLPLSRAFLFQLNPVEESGTAKVLPVCFDFVLRHIPTHSLFASRFDSANFFRSALFASFSCPYVLAPSRPGFPLSILHPSSTCHLVWVGPAHFIIFLFRFVRSQFPSPPTPRVEASRGQPLSSPHHAYLPLHCVY